MYDLTPHEPKPKRDWFAVRMFILIAAFVAVAALIFVSIFPTATPLTTQLQSIALVLGPTATPAPTATPDCRDDILKYKQETLLPILDEWRDAYALASSSSRLSLAQPISMLQEINRRLKKIEPVPCAAGTHYLFIAATESVIEGFLAFMANKSDSEVKAHLETASFMIKALMEEDEPEPTPTASG